MDRKLRILRSVLTFLFSVGILFAALALFPAWAAEPERGYAAPDESFPPEPGDVSAQLLVSSTTGYLIDDGSTGFSPPPPYPTGNWSYATIGGIRGDYIWTAADDSGDVAKWEPDLDLDPGVGNYDVQVHYYAHSGHRTDAEYKVFDAGGVTTVRVNQQLRADLSAPPPAGDDSGWRSLGRFRCSAGSSISVTLSDNTTTWGAGTNVVADAVKFLPETVWVDDSYCSACTNDGHLWGVTAFDNIRLGILAVANQGEVHVGPGLYTYNITVTKPITLSGTGTGTTVISSTSGTAIQVLASNVRVQGFTLESTGADRGIASYDEGAATWVEDITGYVITNNVVRGFGDGIVFYRAQGEISNNRVYNNSKRGIWVQEYPVGVPPGPTTVSGNVLYANGGAVADYDIQVHDTYTGTLVTGNTITGSLSSASEACIYVRNQAGDLTISTNLIQGCARGVWTEIDGTFDNQKVQLQGNTITGGTTGVRVEYTSGGAALPQVTIGGSVANSNSIYGNTGDELRLAGYGADIAATYNYWGVCDLRAIEGEIWHDYDNAALGTVTYEPALCVPYTITVEAAPTSLPADGVSTATVTATVRDVAGNRALPGTMIGITTSLGSVPYGYAEAEDSSAVTRNPPANWNVHTWGDARASDGSILYADVAGDEVSWTFTGEAVSVIYVMQVGGGSAAVGVDGNTIKTINFASTSDHYRVEEVITTALGSGPHTLTVTHQGGGRIWLDAFRSGGAVASQGRITTTLTSSTTTGVASVWGTVYDGRIITSTPPPYPILTDTVSVTFSAANVYVSKSAAPTSLNAGQEVTYTITYGNSGPEIASNTRVTDTLPTDFLYVRSSSSPGREPPTSLSGNKYVWNIGDLASGATGTITVVARPDQSVLWCAPVLSSNVAEIESDVPDPVAGNNTSGPVDVTVVVPSTVAISAHPPAIAVSNGTITTTLRITVTDSNSNFVHNVPISLTTTDGSFPASGATNLVVTTTNGIAFADLASGPTVTTATVTAEVLPACGGMPTATLQVPFLSGLPDVITSTAYPTLIRICGDEAVVTATVRDAFGNLVQDGTEVTFNVVQGERGDMYPRLTTTVNGIATSTVRTKGYLFGPRSLDVYILSRRETAEATALQRIDLEEGPPYVISLSSSPPVLQVGGREAEIRTLILDCGGNSVKDGTVVTFTVGGLGIITPMTTTTSGGWAYATYRSGCTMGTEVISATADSTVGTMTLLLEPGPADLIGGVTADPPSIQNCGGQAVIEATVYDVCGNLVKDGTPVEFAPQYGYVDVEPKIAYTQGGIVTTTATALNKPLATWPTALEQIDVVSPPAFPGFTNLAILPGPVESVEVTASPGSIPINGDVNLYDIIVVAEVTDCSDTWVSDGTAVTLRTDLGLFRESGMRFLHRTTVDGVVTGTLTSQSIAGLVAITATADSAVGTTQVRFLPGEPWLIEVWGYPATIYADGRSTSLVTAWVKDEYHNPVLDGITMTFVTDYGHFLESGDTAYTTTTTIDGYAFATLVSDTTPQTALVRAIAYNSRQGYTYVFFVVPPELKYIYLPIVIRNRWGLWAP